VSYYSREQRVQQCTILDTEEGRRCVGKATETNFDDHYLRPGLLLLTTYADGAFESQGIHMSGTYKLPF
jgi:hypothetical protein